MTKSIDLTSVPAMVSELVSLVHAGTEVVFSEDGKPRAKLVPLQEAGQRVPGLHQGKLQAAPDFEAPLPEGLLVSGF